MGSQLFALALHLDLLREKNIDTRIICHTSGVTKRSSELKAFTPRIPISSLDDYQAVRRDYIRNPETYALSKYMTRRLRHVSTKLGYLAACNTDKEFQAVSARVRQIRGHYSYRQITSNTLQDMDDEVSQSGAALRAPQGINDHRIAIHYRLGDLLNLETKTFVSPTRIMRALNSISSEDINSSVLVSSDSPTKAHEILVEESNDLFDFQSERLPPLTTINTFQANRYFIGTNSKLSLWIVLYRLAFSENKTCWMPLELRSNIEILVSSPSKLLNVRYY
jgi:hypothetical protein